VYGALDTIGVHILIYMNQYIYVLVKQGYPGDEVLEVPYVPMNPHTYVYRVLGTTGIHMNMYIHIHVYVFVKHGYPGAEVLGGPYVPTQSTRYL